MKKFIDSIKYIKLKDLLSPFIFIIALIPSLLFRLYLLLTGKTLWLVSENKDAARDNGYFFYKYIRENHKEDYCFYAINKKCNDYNKVKDLGNIIQFGSLKHWIFYMSAKLNISNQKNGNPNEKFWYVMHVMLNLYNNRVFLQHGITKDNSPWLYYKNTKFKYFVCGVKKEYDYILDNFGYKKEQLLLTGFPRWDSLDNSILENNTILIMPTWRNWLGRDFNSSNSVDTIKDTTFYNCWNGLLNDQRFIDYIETNNIKVYFYPHIHMQKYLNEFEIKSNNIELVSANTDIQTMLKKCTLMITDYSSVAFDFGYMNKSVIYYQFDYDEYREKQLQEGYYKYETDGFGPVCKSLDDVLSNLKYTNNDNNFFERKDNNNSKRLYDYLKEV